MDNSAARKSLISLKSQDPLILIEISMIFDDNRGTEAEKFLIECMSSISNYKS